MVERWTPEKWTNEWSMSRIRTLHTLIGYPAMLNQAFMTLHLEAFPWPQSSLVTLLQSRRCSSGWASNSLPRSGGMLSCISALGKAWTKWSSPKLRAIWMALCLKISSTRKQAYENILRNCDDRETGRFEKCYDTFEKVRMEILLCWWVRIPWWSAPLGFMLGWLRSFRNMPSMRHVVVIQVLFLIHSHAWAPCKPNHLTSLSVPLSKPPYSSHHLFSLLISLTHHLRLFSITQTHFLPFITSMFIPFHL